MFQIILTRVCCDVVVNDDDPTVIHTYCQTHSLHDALRNSRARAVILARTMVVMDGNRIRASRRAGTTPFAIVIPLSVAHAVFLYASIMKGISTRVGPRRPARIASSRAWSVIV